MTQNPPNNFLSQILAAISAIDEANDRAKCLKEIEKDVSLDFVNALGQWIESQNIDEKRFTIGQVLASLSYTIALEIAAMGKGGKSEVICRLTETYADFIHQMAHAIRTGEDREAEENKS